MHSFAVQSKVSPDRPQRIAAGAWAQGLAALAISGLILIIGYLAYHAAARSPEAPRDLIAGAQIRAVVGSAQLTGKQIVVTGFDASTADRQAIVTINSTFSADKLVQLHYRLNSAPPGMLFHLIWRTAADPDLMYMMPLAAQGGVTLTALLSEHPKWEGEVTEIAFRLSGAHRAQAITIEELRLEPPAQRGALSELWLQWTTARGWNTQSINRLYGTASIKSISPAVAMAAWGGLAILLLAGHGYRTGRHRITSYGAACLLPWIAVDLLWQGELSSQLANTRETFAGKTMHEKHLVDIDTNVYSYATRLREEVLPQAPARIFIVHNSFGHNAERLKIQYYLLPHNIYNFGRLPPTSGIRPGDFILTLGDVPELRFSTAEGRLRWWGQTLDATVADTEHRGTLYKISAAPTSQIRPDTGDAQRDH